MDTCVGRLINDCGDKDNVLLLNQLVVLFTGRAGRSGFNGMTGDRFRNRFFDFGHSGYFMKDGVVYDDFMREKWLPVLIGNEPPAVFDERTPPSDMRGIWILLANNGTPIKLALYTGLLVIPTIWIDGLYKNAERQRSIAEERLQIVQSQYLSFIANSLLGDRLDLAMLLSVEANRTSTLEFAKRLAHIDPTERETAGNVAYTVAGDSRECRL